MDNLHLSVALIILIVINAIWRCCEKTTNEGFSIDKLNPVKLIDRVLGKLLDSVLKTLTNFDEGLKPIYLKVKKERSLLNKIKTTFYELVMILLAFIFVPFGAYFTFMLTIHLLPHLVNIVIHVPSFVVGITAPFV
jgi:hypothetical protein